MNPPYDTDPELGPLEHRFLVRFTEALAAGGALLFVVPHYALAASAELLASCYSHLRLWRFPPPDFAAFRQVVLLAKRREEPTPADRFTVQRLRTAAESAEALPVLPDPGGEPSLSLGPFSAHLTLYLHTIDVQGLLDHTRVFAPSASPMGFERDARELLGSPLPVALPPRPAHIALALAAGS